MEYTILILLLPLLSFLFLGLAGMKLKPVVAGAIGTAVLAVVALLSYCTAFEYFPQGATPRGCSPRSCRGTRYGCRSAGRCISTWVSYSTRFR